MARFVREHQELVLIAYTVVLIGALTAFYGWGISSMIGSINTGLTTETRNETSIRVNIEGAQAILKERGLIQ